MENKITKEMSQKNFILKYILYLKTFYIVAILFLYYLNSVY